MGGVRLRASGKSCPHLGRGCKAWHSASSRGALLQLQRERHGFGAWALQPSTPPTLVAAWGQLHQLHQVAMPFMAISNRVIPQWHTVGVLQYSHRSLQPSTPPTEVAAWGRLHQVAVREHQHGLLPD